jgi:hypothetical protein
MYSLCSRVYVAYLAWSKKLALSGHIAYFIAYLEWLCLAYLVWPDSFWKLESKDNECQH